MIKEINIKINKANLKSTREKLLERKKEILNDLDECREIGYYCEQDINYHLAGLFDKLNHT